MKKKIFSLNLKPGSIIHSIICIVVLSIPFTLFGQSQIRYKPTEAIAIIQTLGKGNPMAPISPTHQFGTSDSPHGSGSGSASASTATPEQAQDAMRSEYYKAVAFQLRREATELQNNTIAGTSAALQRTLNKLLPESPGVRYNNIYIIHTQLVQRLSR